jgi:bifunctional ADP-heptose synthase (sugar kinase/adenylyltransferase)
MAALWFVDVVIPFEENTPIRLIEAVKPDILVKGDDYTFENIIGADFVISTGGQVQTIPLVKGYSTTQIITKIKQSY